MSLEKAIILTLLAIIILGSVAIAVYSLAVRDILLFIASSTTLITVVYGIISLREDLKKLK